MKLRWSHCVINVRNLEKMLDFYTDVLGFEVTDRGPLTPVGEAPQIVFMSQDEREHHQLAFVSTREDEDPPNSVNHVAFRADTLADIKGMIRKLEKDGRSADMLPLTHGNAWSIYFKDPEGNGIEVFCDTPWHVAQPQGRTWDPSLSEEDLLAWTEKEFGGEPGFDRIEDFYRSSTTGLVRPSTTSGSFVAGGTTGARDTGGPGSQKLRRWKKPSAIRAPKVESSNSRAARVSGLVISPNRPNA